MPKSIIVGQKKRGRPATGKMPSTTLRLPESLSEQINAWAHKQADAPGRSEAIRRLVELGLKAKAEVSPAAKPGRRPQPPPPPDVRVAADRAVARRKP